MRHLGSACHADVRCLPPVARCGRIPASGRRPKHPTEIPPSRPSVNDLGELMEETISRMAGSTFGSAKQVADLENPAALAGRPTRQRTTTYGAAPAERISVASNSGGVLAGHRAAGQ